MNEAERLRELVYQADGLSARERTALIERTREDDPALADRLAELLEGAPLSDHTLVAGAAPVGADVSDGSPDLPASIGPYQVEGVLGHGATGRVYRAQQTEPLSRPVAIKVVKPGKDTDEVLRRFRNERRALARLQHPNVAAPLDAGRDADDRPYIVMELADGPPITEYARLHALSLDARLELFREACTGVAHAHERGVVHRDLKPSNILVIEDQGRPRAVVIDFGLAMLLAPEADGLPERDRFESTGSIESGAPVGTLAYMSPERVAGATADVSSDVYALGVVLYELLADVLPHPPERLRELPRDRLRRYLATASVVPPSLQRAGGSSSGSSTGRRREADWISLRAIEPDPKRRYPTVDALVADVDRARAGEVVSAVPPTRRYRLRKFASRNRLAVGISVAATVVVTVVVASSLVAIDRIRASRDDARAALDEVQVAADYLEGIVRAASPIRMGPDATLAELLDRAMATYEEDLAGAERVRATLRPVIADAYRNIGQLETSERVFAEAETETVRLFGERSVELAELLIMRTALHERRSAWGALRADAERARSILAVVGEPPARLVVQAGAMRGLATASEGDLQAARQQLTDLWAVVERAGLETSPDGRQVAAYLGRFLRLTGDADEAVVWLSRALDQVDRDDPRADWTARSRLEYDLATSLYDLDRNAEALEVMQAVTAERTSRLGLDHRGTLQAATVEALLLARLERADEALDVLDRVTDRTRTLLGAEAPRMFVLGAYRMSILLDLDEVEAVIATGPAVVAGLVGAEGANGLNAANARSILGEALRRNGDDVAAEAQLRAAAEAVEAQEATSLGLYETIIERLASVFEGRGDAAAAEAWRDRIPAPPE